MKFQVFVRFLIVAAILFTIVPLQSWSYALLSHEAIIDTSWKKSIKPLLKQKFHPTDEELKTAHAYVYGGAIIPDIGYYPLGSPMFSHLVHYVRSGDFIANLFEEAHDINEYAFALGVLCHYEADTYGHSLGTNKAVALLFPKLKKKYGDVVTFEQGRDEHARVEFGFDVLQTARGNYQSNAYHDFIGFQISDSVLERAFVKTYGLHMKSVFESLPAAIAIFRLAVKGLIPELTRDAWKLKNSFITQMNPLATEKNYYYNMDKKNYRKEFTQPKITSFFAMMIIGILPKYGPLSKFKPKVPSPEVEKLFEESFDAIVAHYSSTVNKLKSGKVEFANVNLDTGTKTRMNDYKLADKSYYQLLMSLKKNKFEQADLQLIKNLTEYFDKLESSPDYGTNSRKGRKIMDALSQLNSTQVTQSIQH